MAEAEVDALQQLEARRCSVVAATVVVLLVCSSSRRRAADPLPWIQSCVALAANNVALAANNVALAANNVALAANNVALAANKEACRLMRLQGILTGASLLTVPDQSSKPDHKAVRQLKDSNANCFRVKSNLLPRLWMLSPPHGLGHEQHLLHFASSFCVMYIPQW
jgi:hypothetical protein